ncbi:Threonine/homoserine/homoserine lactone efflux protein [Amycolatopsis sacchari]|uniref:Threonine/homoserine/homoserine lactone efflux protein n=1 Tax=Amycolatopsis sacchari TaxID=115433 RepID=A0A1I3K411_9PSEU|nr:LysE family translocator [Amycolatopsis sacchari]SFI67223.1 Threonine/homoserine/homoserine lactone efflux protein [Amycolatopsis sacchari]
MTNWAGFLPAALLVSLIPGANQLLGLTNAVRHGPGHALAGVGGRLAAFTVLIGLAVAGLGAALAASATALTVIKWVGVAYLLWIGIGSLRQARRLPEADGPAPAPGGWWPVVAHEFAVAISNPKALLLFAALLPQFTTEASGLALLGLAYLVVELVVGLGYIAAGAWLGAGGIRPRVRRRIAFGSGLSFLGLAGLLAVDEVA